jgi:uncharacterized delta-60 repeat protein/uncharacterized repeat protein (TIGR01451 family)
MAIPLKNLFTMKSMVAKWGKWMAAAFIACLACVGSTSGQIIIGINSIVQFSDFNYFEFENAGFAEITLERFNSVDGSISVLFYTTDFTAVDGRDYVGVAQQVNFGDQERQVTVIVPLLDNNLPDGQRIVGLNLAEPSPGVEIFSDFAFLTIRDDETEINSPAGQVQFTSNLYQGTDFETVVPPDGGAIPEDLDRRSVPGILVTVNRVNRMEGKIMVDYRTYDLSSNTIPSLPPGLEALAANAGTNYVAAQGTLVFDDFQTSTNILIRILTDLGNDTNINKRFGIELFNPRPFPGEDPSFILPELGIRSRAQVQINKITPSFFALNSTNAFTNGIAFERATYRVDEYRSIIRIGVVNAGGIDGCTDLVWRDPNNTAGIFQAGSARATLGDNDFSITPEGQHPFYSDFLAFYPGDARLRINWPATGPQSVFMLITININNDTRVEFNEDIFLELRQPNATCATPIGNQRIASVTILADDQPPGAVDREWNPNNVSGTPVPFNPLPGPNNTVRAVAVQTDGKSVIGGDFTAVNSIQAQNRIARLNPDGTLDTSFVTGTGADGFVSSIALYPDEGPNSTNNGKIIIAGGFLSVNGEERQGIARLNPDGSLDTTFNPGSGANGIVWSSLVVVGGRVVIAGDFTEVNGVSRNGIARLNADGTLDMAFDPGTGANGTVWSIGVDKNTSAIEIGAGQSGAGPAEYRTNVDTRATSGTISIIFYPACVPDSIKVYYGGVAIFDSGLVNEFNNDPFCDFANFTGPLTYIIPYGPGPSTQVEIVVNEGSGDPGTVWAFEATIENSVVGERIVLGGDFDTFNGFPRNRVARLNSNGTLDQTFDPGGGPNEVVYAVAVQPDLKVLIGGAFTEVDQLPRNAIARFNPDGSVDETFNVGSGFDDSVFNIAVDPNGLPMVGGVFTEFNGTRRIGLARLNADGSLDTRFMDTAYNHFAGVINPTSYEPNNSVHTIAFQSDGNVMIGGSFRRVGGNHSIDAPRPNRYTVFHRADIAPRHNLARLIGTWGTTSVTDTNGNTTVTDNAPQGPGNMAFLQPSYSVDEHGIELAARLVRTNGFLGRVSSVAISTQNLATAGVDYTNAVNRFTWIAPHPPNPLVLFFRVPVIDDALIESDENISMSLVQPQGQITLGGEILPLGGALGRAFAPVTIIDNDFDQGQFVFSAPVYNVNEGAGTVTLTVYRIGGSTTPVQVDYYTLPGTALDGDFRPRTGTLNFGQGTTNQTITITLTNQPTVEPDETFFVVLTNATGSSSLGFSTTDPSFDPGLGANGTIHSISFITNFVNRGRIYVGGEFTSYGPTNTLRGHVARILENGSLDSTFSDPQVNSNVLATLVEPAGTLLVGGQFTQVANSNRSRIARLNTDGTVASSFDPLNTTNPPPSTVRALALNSQLFFWTNMFTNIVVTTNAEPPGSTNLVVTTNTVVTSQINNRTNEIIIAGGDFGLLRYGPDGAADTNFYNSLSFNGPVYSLAVQPTNRTILVAGAFSLVNGQTNNGLVRLLPDFTIDPTFIPATDSGAFIRSVDITSRGFVVIGGLFRIQNNSVIQNVARLRLNGDLDLAFNPGTGPNDEVFRILVQREQNFLDRVLVAGKFTAFNGRPRNHVARLLTDGRVDESFYPSPAANAPVWALATQLDNKVLAGGEFNLFSGLLRNRIARVGPSVATVNIIDDDHFAGRFSFVDATFSTNENNLSATIYVKRTGGNSGQVQVTASTSAGTATPGDGSTPGDDYQNVTNVLTWVSFDTNTIKSFTVPIVGDGLVENPETVNLYLRNPTGGAVLGLSNAVLVIDNDDAYGTLAFSQQNFETDENGTGAAITIVRTGGSAETVSAQFHVYGLNATTNDFTPLTNTVTFGPGQTSTNFTIPILQDFPPDQDGDKVVEMRLLNPVNASLGLPNPATLTIIDDESFNIPAGGLDTVFGATAAANSPVYALALQPDGKFFIAGDFTIVNDVTRNRVARLNPNGSLDGRFNAGVGPDLPVRSIALQDDGKLVIGGFFKRVHGTNRAGVARLNRDGTLDNFFNPGSGANNPVYAVALDAIGQVFIGGAFDTVRGITRPGIALLNTNGTLNTTFNPGTGANGTVYTIVVQPDGKIVIGGDFSLVNNEPRSRLARLNPDGSVDGTFNPAGIDAAVRTIALQPDRKILIGGSFTSINGTNRNFLARLNPDGSLDTAFFRSDEGANNAVYALALQADGKILVGGDFTTFHGRNRHRITRLLSNGKLDPAINFGTGANSFVAALAIQPDRRIILGGGFTTFDDQPRGYFARIYGGSLSGSGAFEFISPYFTAAENGQKAIVTVRRRGGTAGDTTVDFQTVDGTAVSGMDYVSVPWTTLFFSEGEAVQTVEIPVINDAAVEETEFFGVVLEAPSGGADLAGQPSATVNIVNDDSIIRFLSPTFNVSESNLSAVATITVLRSGATNTAVSVDYVTADGTAIAGSDYSASSDTITFGPNELVKKFTVPILDDALVEGNETVALSLTNLTGSAVLGISSAELIIVDNDFAPGQLNFSSAVYVVNEYETNIVITVVRTNGTTGIISVDYATSDGLARAGLDYIPVSGTLSFADNESIKTFSVPVIPDYVDETNETVILALSNPRAGATLGGTSTAVLTILNSRLINGNLNLSQPQYTVSESNALATFTVTRTLGSSGAVSVNFRTLNGTAIGGVDFTSSTGSVTWASGDATPKTFTVPVTNDGMVEPTEDFIVELFNPSGGATLGATPRATVFIQDNDFGPGNLGLASAVFTVSENGTNAVVEVVRTFGNTGTVAIAYAVAPGGTAVAGVDYTNVSGILTFGPGVTNQSFLIPIIDDFIVEVDKTLKVELSNPTGGATTNGQIIAAVVTIVENDQEAGSLDLSFNNLGANDQIYTVVIQTNNNKIFVGGDFTQFSGLPRSRIARLQPNGAVDASFDAGGVISNSVRAVALQADGKVVVGGAFTFVPTGASNFVNYLARLHVDGMVDTNFLGAGLAGVDNFVYALAVQNDGRILAGGAFTSVNGATRNRIVRLDSTGAIDLNFSPTAGADGVVRTIALQHDGKILIGGDFGFVNGVSRNGIARLNPNGTLDAGFDPGIGASDSVQAIALQADGSILVGGLFTEFDGMTVNRLVRLLESGDLDSTFDEATGANEFVSSIAVQPDGRILVGGGFTAFNDIPRGGLTRLLANGSTDPSINFGRGANNYISTVALQSDRKIIIGGGFTEFDGRPRPYIARLNGGENLGPGSLAFTAANYNVVENQTNITITVRRLIGTTNTVTVNFATANGTALAGTHYRATNGTLSFAPGETIKTFTIPIIDDLVINANRTINLTLSNPSGGASLGMPSAATVTIINNDDVLGFNIAFYSVSENAGQAVVTVERTGGSVGTVTVDYTTQDGTAIAGADYQTSAGTLVFTNGQTIQTFTVPIINDTLVEGNESVDLILSGATGTAILGRQLATLTIVDDDFSPGLLGFTQPVFTVSERGVVATISVARGGGSSGAASVDYSTGNGTATAGLDYTGTSGRLVFADNEFFKTFTVPISDDSLVEGAESVSLALFNPVGSALGVSTAVLTILGDEAQFNFAQTNFFVIESNLLANITVTRSSDGTGPVSVEFATSNNTAIAGSDYVSTNRLLSWAAGDFTPRTVTVQIINDLVGEVTEDLQLWLINSAGESLPGATNNVPLTILDDDSSFSFDAASYFVNEGATNALITILRTGFATGTASVNFATSDGTARAGEDYVFTGITVTFTNGQTFQTVSVPIINDTVGEPDETVNLILQNPSSGTALGIPSTATLTIIENEDVISFAGADFTVDETGSNAVITVIRRGIPTGAISVNYATGTGTATAGADYNTVSGIVNFQPFDTVQTFTVPIIDDTLAEGDETVTLRLFNLVGSAFLVAPTNATLTIVDNDVSVRFSAATYNIGESQTNASVTVVRVGAVGPAFSVSYATSNGTAVADSDYAPVSGVVNFGAGQTTRTIIVPILDDLLIEGNESLSLRLFGPAPANVATLGAPATATLTIVDDDASIIVPAGAALLSESISPPNGLVDADEMVTINFGFRNIGNVDTANLSVTLLNTNGVIVNGANQRNLGIVRAGGPTRTGMFSFTANGTNGGRVIATFRVVDGANNLGLVTFTFILGQSQSTFANNNSITINDNTLATPYPSTINVSNVSGILTKTVVTLNNINHTYPDDIDVLLVGPQGQKVVLMSDVGGGNPLSNVILSFDDKAASTLPDAGQVVSGLFRPANYAGPGTADSFPPPAPGLPYTNTFMSVFANSDPNGTWSLFVVDDALQDGGNIAGGWSLAFTTTDALAPSADICITASDSPDPIMVGGDLTYVYRVTNYGPSMATGIVYTNVLPAGAQYISSTHSTGGSGTYRPATGTLDGIIGTLASEAGMTITVVVRPNLAGTVTSTVNIQGGEHDVNPDNNTAAVKTTVNGVPLVATRQGTNTVVLSWPAAANGFVLQSCNTLPPASGWSNVSSPPSVVVGSQRTVTLQVAPGEKRFYRLHRP